MIDFATPDDVEAVKAIADANRKELGFVLRAVIADAIAKGEVILSPGKGFLHFHHRRDQTSTLYHLAVIKAERRQGVGRDLIAFWIDYGRSQGIKKWRLKCPEGLPANLFYESIGFSQVAIELGRKRRLVVWERYSPDSVKG